MNNSMLIISSYVGELKSFRLMPLTSECIYTEGIYDPTYKSLILLSKYTKEGYHFIPKLDDQGDMEKIKKPRVDSNKPYKEERRLVNTPYEYILTEKSEIKNFLQFVAINANEFDVNKYLDPVVETEKEPVAEKA